ncbi:Apolipophorins [Hypsibius exemplaris]|uniref:Apolipophorins n=1 Tax=Hypsibius exemplaris TaxID=2072580 RepID=A0A1W0WHY3_HYPEX|nr:Apolipophorins [Hypsibius exemplaris]
MKLTHFVLLISTATSVLGDQSVSCAQKTCVEGAFKYTPGKTYQYTYTTEIASTLLNQPEATTFSLHLTAEISVLAACSHRLSVKLHSVSEKNDTAFPADAVRQLRDSLQAHPVEFGFYNGKVGEVCSATSESAMSLNIKRGVLSAFQVSATTATGFTKGTFLEVDMAGECPAVYTLNNGENDQFHLTKTRLTSECSDRHPATGSLLHQSTLGSTVQALLESDPSCQHMIRDGVLRTASCVERHTIKPFRQQPSPLSVRVTQQLTFLSEISTVPQVRKNNDRQLTGSLQFVLAETPKNTDATLEESLEALCNVTKDDVRPETPALFAELVEGLQAETNCTAFDALFTQLVEGELCSALTSTQRYAIFHDTIPAVGTVCSVKLMSRLLVDGTVDFSEAELWFVSLAFIRDPTKEMIDALVPLLSKTELPRSGYLGISTVTRNYCAFSGAACEIAAVETAILQKLNPSCDSNEVVNTTLEETVTYIKAIGNLGTSPFAAGVLQLIVQCRQKPVAVRVAAVEAFRRRNCGKSAETTVLSTIFADSTEDVELRVAAYRTLLTCPSDSDSVLTKSVQLVAAADENAQLRQYLASHLRNLNATTGTSFAEIRETLSDFALPTDMDTTGPLTSRNTLYESGEASRLSYVEGNVLFTDSYLPRSADLGFGVELFGRRLDLLKFGARAEGFEETVERMVGPSGHFSRRSLKDSIMSLLFGSDPKTVNPNLLTGRINRQRQQFNYKEKDADFLAYFRMFDNDLAFFTYDDVKTAADLFVQRYTSAMDFFFGRTEMTPFEFSRNVILHDGDYVIKTSSGLPLKLELGATASGKLSGQTRLNIGGFLSSTSGLSLDGQISPSLAVQVTATFKLDLHGVSTGFTTVSTLHSSTDLSGSVHYQDGKFLKAAWNLPKEKVEFVSFSSKSYGIRGDEVRLIESDPSVSEHVALSECTAPLTSRLFGVEFCAELDSEDPLAENGKRDGLLPANFRLFLRKTDPGMTGYKFDLEYPTRDSFRVLFDTPGSRISRHLELSYLINRQNGSLTGTFTTPWKQYDLDFAFTALLNFHLQILEDKSRPYRLTVATPDSRNVDGAVILEPKLTLTTPYTDPIEVSGIISAKPEDVRADFNIRSRILTSRVLATHKRDGPATVTQATVQYRTPRTSRSQEVLINWKCRNFPTTSHLKKQSITASVEFTEFADLNTLVQTDVLYAPADLWSHIDVTWNVYRKNFQDESKKIVVRSLLTSKQTAGRWNVTTGISLQGTPVDFAINHSQEWDSDMQFFDGRLTAGDQSLRLAWNNKWQTDRRISAEAGITAGDKFLTVTAVARDESALLSRSYPFEVTVSTSAEARPTRLIGELSGTRSDVSLNVDIHRGEEKYMTSSHTASWNPMAFTSQYQVYPTQQAGTLHATVITPTDWVVRTQWDQGGAHWTAVLGVMPHKEHAGYGLLALLTKGTMRGRPLYGGLYQELKYGVDFEYFRNPEVKPVDTRASVTVYTGLKSHEARSILQFELSPLRNRLLSLVDITIAHDPLPLMFVSNIEAVISDGFNGTVSILQNFTTAAPSYVRVESSHAIADTGEGIVLFRLTNSPTGQPLIALDTRFQSTHFYGNVQFALESVLNGTLIRYKDKLDQLALTAGLKADFHSGSYSKFFTVNWNSMDPDNSAISYSITGNSSVVGFSEKTSITTPWAALKVVEVLLTTEVHPEADEVYLTVQRNGDVVFNVTGFIKGLNTPNWRSGWITRFPTIQDDWTIIQLSKKATGHYDFELASSTAPKEPLFRASLELVPGLKRVEVFTSRRTYQLKHTSNDTQKDLEFNWNTPPSTEKLTARITRTIHPTSNGHKESWTVAHPSLDAPTTLNLQYAPTPKHIVMVGLNNGPTIRAVPVVTKNAAKVNFLYESIAPTQDISNLTEFTPNHEIGGGFTDDNTLVMKASARDTLLLGYNAALKDGDKFHQKTYWNTDSASQMDIVLMRNGHAILEKIGDLVQQSAAQWAKVHATVSSHLQQIRSTSTQTNSAPVISRQRRNAFAFAGSSGGCSSGSFAVAGAYGGTQCVQSSGGSGDFAAVASSVHSQISSMMQDMVARFQSRPQQQQSSSGYSSGVINVQVGAASSPCGQSQQRTSYGGCAPAPAPPAPQTHRIEITVGGGGRGGQQQQQQAYQQDAPPSYQQPSYRQAQPSSSYAASYSTNVEAQPSYGPVDAYAQPYAPQPGAQMHAQQKSSQSGQSYQVPVGNTRLTIHVHHQEEPQPAPAPSPCGAPPSYGGAPSPCSQPAPSPQGYAQYVASGSQQSQYAVAGQIPIGGGAEPRLQYCQPGSTEKGVCLNEGEASLEPTRSKRDVEVGDETIGALPNQPYLHVVKRTAYGAWNTFVAQPEVQYILDLTQRISEYVSYKTRATSVKSLVPSAGSVTDLLRNFAPTVTRFVTGSFNGITVEQPLPFRLQSLRQPIPKFTAPAAAAASVLMGPNHPAFHGKAILSNSNSIVTFNGLSYTLNPVPCRYVFAHDFDDGNFTLVLTYGTGAANLHSPVHLIEVEVMGRLSAFKFNTSNIPQAFEQFPDFTVITSRDPDSVLVASTDGWSVLYKSQERELSLTVSQLYSNKIAGLGGSFDMVPHNDFLTPTRAVLKRHELSAFLDAWQVDDSCRAN